MNELKGIRGRFYPLAEATQLNLSVFIGRQLQEAGWMRRQEIYAVYDQGTDSVIITRNLLHLLQTRPELLGAPTKKVEKGDGPVEICTFYNKSQHLNILSGVT